MRRRTVARVEFRADSLLDADAKASFGEEGYAFMVEAANRHIPRLIAKDLSAMRVELATRLFIENYVRILRSDLSKEVEENRLHYRGILFCTRDPENTATVFDRPTPLIVLPAGGIFDQAFIEQLHADALKGQAWAIALACGTQPGTPEASSAVYVTLEFIPDHALDGWAAPVILDAEGRRLGAFEPTAPVDLQDEDQAMN